MVYECEICKSPLPPGVTACPKCGKNFDEAVPQDAESFSRGWQSRVTTSNTSLSEESAPTISSSASSTNPNQILANNSDREYWQHKAQQTKDAVQSAIASPNLRRFNQKPLFIGIGSIVIIVVLIVLIRPHTNEYVFEQHPTYQSTMTQVINSEHTNRAKYTWPYEGHENCLLVTYPNNSNNPSETPTKNDMDRTAKAERIGFCVLRYRSGFTPEEAMNCQVSVSLDGSFDTLGYDGPEVSPDQDAILKGQLDQAR